MKFLPWDKQTLKTNLTQEEALKKLSLSVDAERYIPRWLSNNKTTKFFAGEIKNNTFKIFRIIQGRDSFRPIIIGKIEEDHYETVILLKMRLHLLVLLLQSLWCLVIGSGALVFLNNTINHHQLDSRLIGALFLLIFNYLMTIIFFNIQRTKSLEELKKIFEIAV